VIDEAQVWQALGTVMDPEIPYSVVDLGLVYGVTLPAPDRVRVALTLTTRGCPLVRRIADDVKAAVAGATGATDVEVEIVWDPPWNRGMASEHVRRELGWL
jgi:metal-sulfur cluster biosynthetic enzyme